MNKGTSTVRTFAKNSVMIITSHVITKILSLIFVAFAARYLGTKGFGQYSFIFALMSFFVVMTALGLDTLLVREIAKDKSQINSILINSIYLKLFLILLSWAILAILILILNKSSVVNIGIILIALCLVPNSIRDSIKAAFNAYEIMEYNTLIEIVFRFIVVVLGLTVIYFSLGFIALISVSVISSISTGIISYDIFSRRVAKIKCEFDIQKIKDLFRKTLPFALTGLFVSIYFRIDVVMLSLMKGDKAVGWYSAAYNLSESVIFISAAVCGSVFPIFSRLYNNSKQSFNLAYEKTFKVLLLLGLPIGLGTTMVSDKIIFLVYGYKFSNSIIILQILIWASVIIFLNSLLGFVLYSVGKQKQATITTFLKIIANVSLNLILIPKYSYIGAALATVGTELIGLIVYFYIVSKNVFRLKIMLMIYKPLIASVIMAISIGVYNHFNLAFLILGGSLIYGSILILLRTFTPEDKYLIKKLLTVSN